MDNQVFIKRVWMPDGSIISANLVYRDRPVLILDSGEKIVDDKSKILYEMTHELILNEIGEIRRVLLSKPARVCLTPHLVTLRKYSSEVTENDLDIYPPSSYGFYGRLIRGVSNALYIVQNIAGDNHLWLTIVDPVSIKIYASHKIQPYEYGVIRLKSWIEHFYDLVTGLSPPNPEKNTAMVLGVVDNTDLSWKEIYRLTGGIVPSSFIRDGCARKTLGQLIPIEKFPEKTRDEILAFLVWVAKEIMPKNDIIEFLEQVYFFPMFRTLIGRHLQFIFDDRKPPSYIEIMREAAEGNSTGLKLLPEEAGRWSPDILLRRKIDELLPDWSDEAVEIINDLSKSSEIITTLPVPKVSPQSRIVQRKRLIMNEIGLRLRTNITPRALGLREIVYIGSAHRWPHIHLAFSIRLGDMYSRSPYLQNMIMPLSASEQVKRILPNVLDIEWSHRTLNVNLYSSQKRQWTLGTKGIIDSVNKSVSLKKIQNEFGYWNGTSVYIPTFSEARLLDMTSTLFYLSDLESKAGQNYWQTDATRSREMLTKLRDMGIIKIFYWFDRRLNLSTVFIHMQGPELKVCSLTRALLKNTPSCLAMIADGGTTSLVIARVSLEDTSDLSDSLALVTKDSSMEIKSTFPSAHQNYTSDLFQRLLNSDRTWNDDVSAFLSQIRSVPKPFGDDGI